MAKSEKPTAVTPAAGKPTPAGLPAAANRVRVVVRRDTLQVGDTTLVLGDPLAEVTLSPGVSLGYLSRALEDGLAGPAL